MWFLLAVSCTPSPEPLIGGTGDDPPIPPDSPVLTVEGGYGGGRVAAGATVHVWARVDPQTAIVTGWSGDVPLVEWNGALQMPDHDWVLRPTVEVVPTAVEVRTYPLDGRSRTALVAVAPTVRGLVLFFHGAGYAVDQLRDNAASTIVKHLVRAGYTVVAVQSEAEAASGIGGWDASLAGSVDLDNVRALLAALAADGTWPVGAPMVAWGMSSGGNFAHTVGAALPADVVLASCAPGSDAVAAVTRAPTGWYLAAEDRTFPTAAEDAARYASTLAVRGVATDLYVHPPTPLYDQRFERVRGIDAARSAAIAASLRAGGEPDLADLDPAVAAAVGAEIEIMAADHELYDDAASRMVGFVEATR